LKRGRRRGRFAGVFVAESGVGGREGSWRQRGWRVRFGWLSERGFEVGVLIGQHLACDWSVTLQELRPEELTFVFAKFGAATFFSSCGPAISKICLGVWSRRLKDTKGLTSAVVQLICSCGGLIYKNVFHYICGKREEQDHVRPINVSELYVTARQE
jgi:hypothetical protein